MEKLVIAVDPGREKCGIAVVGRKQGIVHKAVIPTGELIPIVKNLLANYQIDMVVLGDRTTSKDAKRQLQSIQSSEHSFSIALVDEHRSTDAARRRYWQDYPPHGLKALLPTTMQTPPVPVDDYVAVILAERFFKR